MFITKIFINSFLSLFAIMRISSLQTKNPLSIIIFLILLFIFYHIQSDSFNNRVEKSDAIHSCLLGTLFSLFTIAAKYHTLIGTMTNKLFCATILIMCFAGFIIIYTHLLLWLIQATDTLHITNIAYSEPWLPYIASTICFICQLPYFLNQFPGIMTPDSINQYAQVIGAYELSNHHSIIHTALLGILYNVGLSITHSPYGGLAFYTISQMLFMSFVAGYVLRTLQKANIKSPILLVVAAFYALIPYNNVYAVTIWKDIPFAGFMTLFCATLVRFTLRPNVNHPKGSKYKISIAEYITTVFPYIISGIMLCLLRSNGWYLFIITLPVILFVYRAHLKALIPMNLLILAAVLFVKFPVMNVYNIKQPDFVESLSIPVQQIARVISNREALTQEQTDFLEKIIDISEVATLYQPNVSDNIKNLIRKNGIDYLESHKNEFFKTWISIGLDHPKAYFDAYVDQTNGYWYPDIYCEIGLAEGIYPNDFGLTWQPILRGSIIVKIKEIIFKLPDLIPLYGILWSVGIGFWIVLISTMLCLRQKKYSNAIVCLPALLLVATLCIATPVAADFRYVYGMVYSMPLFILVPFISNKSE